MKRLAFCPLLPLRGVHPSSTCAPNVFVSPARPFLLAPGRVSMSAPSQESEERFDVLREDGTHMGFSKARSLVHRDGDWHRSTHVFVCATDGRVLVQLRARGKDTFPGRWDVSAAGHIEAGGDSFECATRELEEELGIVAGHSELEFVASVQAMATGETKLHGKYKDNEIQDVYVYWPSRTVSIDDMRLQEEEVERVEYWKWNDYQARSLANDDLLVPRSPMYKRIVFPWISRQMALPTDSGV